jgi:hypothetical protein
MASNAIVLFYTSEDATDLQNLLADIAGAKSPAKRDTFVMQAYLLNARIARSALKTIALRSENSDTRQNHIDADWIDARYCDWESTIRNIEYASRRALRK